MKVHDTRSQSRTSGGEEEKVMTRKQKAEAKAHEAENSPKKVKPENENDPSNGDSNSHLVKEFDDFSKATKEHLSVEVMVEILKANGQDTSGPDEAIVSRCQDLLFYGPLEKCPVCTGNLEFDGVRYSCNGTYSEWSTCMFSTREPPRKKEPTQLPGSVQKSAISGLIKKYKDPNHRPKRDLRSPNKPFTGMLISMAGRLSRTHAYWMAEIEKHGGKVSNSVHGVTCLVVSHAERERGGSSKLVEAMESGMHVVREAWLADSIQKQEAQPLEAYEVVADLSTYGKGIPLDKQDPDEEALETLTAKLKLYGKRSVHEDTKLKERGGKILEKDGILYNCAFSICDMKQKMNDYCIMQLITVPDSPLHMYYTKGRIGDESDAEERLEEWDDEDSAIKEFESLFEEVTGNEFEPWERDKKFQKKPLKFYPIDMDDGVDVRYGGLGLRQHGIAVTHCTLDPVVANFMKVLCGWEIYKYALMEMGYDSPNLPIGMLSSIHIRRSEEVLLEFVDKVKSLEEKTSEKVEAIWSDFSQRWFTLMSSTRPFIFRDYSELADHAASALESIRDVNVASHLIGDMNGGTADDPLSDRYRKLGCSITHMDKKSDDYKMIVNYLDKTYEPVRVGDMDYGVSVENIFMVESEACPYDDIKKFSKKLLLWCGTRSCNLLRHLHKGFLPAICSLPVSGYMFGRGIICSDSAAEAARYGFTTLDRPEGFLVLAVVSVGDELIEFTSPPQDTGSLEEKKQGAKGLGRKKTDESQHLMWKDGIKVPCGQLIPSEHKDSPLEYNEYAVYDPKQTCIRFLVKVNYEEKGVVMETEE